MDQINKYDLQVGDKIEFINKGNYLVKLEITRIEDKSCYTKDVGSKAEGGRNSWNTVNSYIEKFNAKIIKHKKMKKKKDLYRIIELIEDELENNCDPAVYPEVCTRVKNHRLKRQIIIQTINLVAQEGMNIDSAIAQIEAELQESTD